MNLVFDKSESYTHEISLELKVSMRAELKVSMRAELFHLRVWFLDFLRVYSVNLTFFVSMTGLDRYRNVSTSSPIRVRNVSTSSPILRPCDSDQTPGFGGRIKVWGQDQGLILDSDLGKGWGWGYD